MPPHDIMDKRRQKLVDNINQILSTTESVCFAFGYSSIGTGSDCDEKLAASEFKLEHCSKWQF
jgi:hypothetical protein